MHFHLRTLLAIMSLSAVVSAGFSAGVLSGLLAYILCLSLFMATWRVRLVCERHDLRPFAWIDSWLPWEILFEAVWISLAAVIAFWLSFAFILALLLEASTQLPIFFSVPLGTLAALIVFWLTWPREPNYPPTY
jgi:hypothetical protein